VNGRVTVTIEQCTATYESQIADRCAKYTIGYVYEKVILHEKMYPPRDDAAYSSGRAIVIKTNDVGFSTDPQRFVCNVETAVINTVIIVHESNATVQGCFLRLCISSGASMTGGTYSSLSPFRTVLVDTACYLLYYFFDRDACFFSQSLIYIILIVSLHCCLVSLFNGPDS